MTITCSFVVLCNTGAVGSNLFLLLLLHSGNDVIRCALSSALFLAFYLDDDDDDVFLLPHVMSTT